MVSAAERISESRTAASIPETVVSYGSLVIRGFRPERS
jgi:hypothetical protein